MLGHFALTSSFSRRSNPGFSMGSTEFGFRFCERVFPNVCSMWVPHSSNFAIQSRDLGLLARKRSTWFSVAMFHYSHMGRSARIGSRFCIQTRLRDMRQITRGVFVDLNAPQAAC